MVQVVWTRRALADLRAIRAYIEQFSPLAAQRFSLSPLNLGNSLEEQPKRGRSLGGDRRELTTATPYLIRYRIRNGIVEITTIRHGAQRPA